MKIALSGLALALSIASPALAQSASPPDPLPKGNSLAEVQQRKAANDEQVKLAQAQLAQNAASKAAHDEAMQAYQAQLTQAAQQQADAERAHQEAMAKWQADVAACKAGDTKRCGG